MPIIHKQKKKNMKGIEEEMKEEEGEGIHHDTGRKVDANKWVLK